MKNQEFPEGGGFLQNHTFIYIYIYTQIKVFEASKRDAFYVSEKLKKEMIFRVSCDDIVIKSESGVGTECSFFIMQLQKITFCQDRTRKRNTSNGISDTLFHILG